MLYFSSEVKMEGPKEKWGQGKSGTNNFFRAGIRTPHFQFVSYAYEFTTSARCDIDVLLWRNVFFNRKKHKIRLVNSQENY